MLLILVPCSQEPQGLTRPLNATDMEKGDCRRRQFLNGANKESQSKKKRKKKNQVIKKTLATRHSKLSLGLQLKKMLPISS